MVKSMLLCGENITRNLRSFDMYMIDPLRLNKTTRRFIKEHFVAAALVGLSSRKFGNAIRQLCAETLSVMIDNGEQFHITVKDDRIKVWYEWLLPGSRSITLDISYNINKNELHGYDDLFEEYDRARKERLR